MSSTRSVSAFLANLSKAQTKHNIFISTRPIKELQSTIPNSTTTVAIKDNICTLEEPTTCGSKMLYNFTSPYEATVVSKVKAFGSAIIGKTNLDQFGMGSATTNSHFGITTNPLFPTGQGEAPRISGGSSGGSAAAVAAEGVADYALGTDTGGSVRVPAALNGVYGLKPSYGRISRWGVIAYAQSLDTVGIMAKDLELLESVYRHLDDYDVKDPTSLLPEFRDKIKKLQGEKEQQNEGQLKYRIGVPEEFMIDLLSDKVKTGLTQSLTKLQDQGHEIVPISIPNILNSIYVYFTLASSEASSNLSRYDGIRYGYRSNEDTNAYAKTRTEGFGEVVQDRIILGNYNLSSGSYEKNFLKASQVRNELRMDFNKVFKFEHIFNPHPEIKGDIDFILSPTATTIAPTVEQYQQQTIPEGYAMDILAAPASLAGLPALSVPWFVDDEIPIGLQIISQYGNDDQLFEVAKLLKELN